jgi:Rrf2 family protein
MHPSTRLTVALHVLTLLAIEPERSLTSEYIATSVNTNPVVIRRVLGLLRKVGIVSSQPGSGGGWTLARRADGISVREVRDAVEDPSPFAMHASDPNPACPVGRHIQGALSGVYADAERAMAERLAQTTVASLLRSVQRRSTLR